MDECLAGGVSYDSNKIMDLIDAMSNVYSDCYQRSQTATSSTEDIDLSVWGSFSSCGVEQEMMALKNLMAWP